jgi:hypothetical protein
MARCQHQTFIGSANRYEMCGAQATHIGKMPFKTEFEHRCEAHADELQTKMPLRGAAKEPMKRSDAR